MAKVIVNSFEEYQAYAGKELGVSEYLTITQDRINMFADATLDHQWIHTDPERAKTESTFKSTIAHGYLTMSLIPHFLDEIIEVRNLRMLVNYGMEKLKFNQAVLVNSEVRLRAHVNSVTNLMGIVKVDLKTIIEIKDSPKSALEANVLLLYYFNK